MNEAFHICSSNEVKPIETKIKVSTTNLMSNMRQVVSTLTLFHAILEYIMWLKRTWRIPYHIILEVFYCYIPRCILESRYEYFLNLHKFLVFKKIPKYSFFDACTNIFGYPTSTKCYNLLFSLEMLTSSRSPYCSAFYILCHKLLNIFICATFSRARHDYIHMYRASSREASAYRKPFLHFHFCNGVS